MKRGFTLIELLVVVLIIGVLTAVALPQYQTAVDKSRYATLMPMAKSVANAQEAFYMNGGHYSDDLAYLDVQLPNDPSGTVANVGDGLKVEISEDSDYGFVKMSKEGLENNYIIYQENSLNYPKEIHCEALTGSERAERLCKSLGGSFISGSLTDGYDTYVLEGGGSGTPWSLAHADTEPAGVEGCDSYPCVKECTAQMNKMMNNLFGGDLIPVSCQATYQEDGSMTEGFCIPDEGCVTTEYTETGANMTLCMDVEGQTLCPYEYQFNSQGEVVGYTGCNDISMIGENGRCTSYSDVGEMTYEYDNEGNKISASDRYCSGDHINSNGHCSSYDGGGDTTFDNYGNPTHYRQCSSGDCTSFNNAVDYTYEYDINGNKISSSSKSCWLGDGGDGNCSTYDSGEDIIYDNNGIPLSIQSCSFYDEDGNCRHVPLSRIENTYDENGNRISYRECHAWGGGCGDDGCSSQCDSWSDWISL
ncbi:MAG: prepilin-type N-terminal cleavage/methylation domain-containing protein [Elusimicrobiaceae bacterium]|nr:prepilin-type N-terminal cleavage/methylation domain-containing protein [Elusimicrobiaceae bacterium]